MGEWDNQAGTIEFNLQIDWNTFSTLVQTHDGILDFGCGYGRISNVLQSRGYRNIIGIDASSHMINRGRSSYPHLNLKHHSGSPLPFPDHNFDVIITCAVFTCIPSNSEKTVYMNELIRILKPSGIIHLVEFCAKNSAVFISSTGIRMKHSTSMELRNLLTPLTIISENIKHTPTLAGSIAASLPDLRKESNLVETPCFIHATNTTSQTKWLMQQWCPELPNLLSPQSVCHISTRP